MSTKHMLRCLQIYFIFFLLCIWSVANARVLIVSPKGELNYPFVEQDERAFLKVTEKGVTEDLELAPGVYMLEEGIPDSLTPFRVFRPDIKKEAMKQLPVAKLPFDLNDIRISVTDRGCQVEVPLEAEEQLYGFGLQIETFGQRGLRRRPIVNDNPYGGLGLTHGPQTFYISNKGYGILVNTARYTTFLCGSNQKQKYQPISSTDKKGEVALTTDELYKNRSNGNGVHIDIPGAKGIEVFVISGPDIKSVVQRYNLLSGGGCLPPMWGLGFKYRVKGDAVQDSVMRFAKYFRENKIPCDVIGLEPGWHTAAYSCSYVWSDRFPCHQQMIQDLKQQGYKVNLWEHAYVNPAAPFYEKMKPYAGDYLVWNGLVPDFTTPEARELFTGHHQTLMEEGISGFKMDECDNSNVTRADATWGFPDMSRFPSGLDGEQMHQLFGSLYVTTLDSMYRKANRRAYQDYRASGMFISSVPAVIYSDIYGHEDYIRMMCNAAFGGLLWCPEVRESHSPEEFFHRLQTVILSPQAMVNAWYLQYAPWLQFDRDKNNRAEFLPEAKQYEQYSRELINLRMQLIPYLYSAFFTYQQQGVPPFRPLIMDYPNDPQVEKLDDQYMVGDALMAAPLYKNTNRRTVYFPEGIWYNFNTNETYKGGKSYEIETAFNQLPLYVKVGTILPLAEPVPFVSPTTCFQLTCKVYGNAATSVSLLEDDGESYDYQSGVYNIVTLQVDKKKVKLIRNGDYKGRRFVLAGYEFVP